MACMQTIREKMRDAATSTLGDAYGSVPGKPGEPVVDALLSSRIVALYLESEQVSAAELPLPPISRQFEMQLHVLWRHHQAPGADRAAITGAIDRIVAELYRLSTDDLITMAPATSAMQ